MLPMVDDPSAAGAAASSSFPDADAYGNGDSEDIDFPVDPISNAPFSSSAAVPAPAPAAAAAAAGGERRPLFQRLWTEEDEIVILRAFAEFTAQRGTAFASHQYDTDPFYEEMRRRLQLDFSKSQLAEKLRRLKRKYRNCVDRLRVSGNSFTFRSPHEQAVFEIARNIWRPASDKHGRDPGAADSDDDATVTATNNGDAKSPSSSKAQRRGRRRRTADFAADPSQTPQFTPASMPVKTEDSLPAFFPQVVAMDGAEPVVVPAAAQPTINTESSVLTPLFKEMVRAMLGMGGCPSPLGLGAKVPEPPAGIPMEGDKWRQQRILELEVYLRRIDLLQDEVKSALEELKSSTPAT
ncbi:probable transcription factor At5g28040 [Lolium rigidum]|uniref:probable transcription factor At5g28040 n=1 Tax=Lolium rigidum TaxID=89674 RepID=UPI001F5DD5CE|nr:probable transcription factor At5g28040 [Lolium rigidum]